MIKNQSLNVITNMGISINSHGKKSDKETQSPLLKIFKEIMMRENNDPEKRNLLDQKEERKRKPYNGSKAKMDRRSDSNSSVHRKRSPYKVISAEQRNINVLRGSNCGDNIKKDSWWKWKKGSQIENADDTCSCVSCALKRIVSSEYACIGCLVLVFCISIVVACLLVFKNIPMVASDTPPKTGAAHLLSESTTITDSERLKRKIELINENRMKNELSEEGVFGKPHYDDIRSDPMDLPGSSEIDFGPNLRELNSLEDSESRAAGDMGFSALEPEKVETHSSDKLKEFYTKLVQTDAKIKNLKKILSDNNLNNSPYDGSTPDRTKRSLKLYHPDKPVLIRRKRQAHPVHQLKRIPKRKGKLKRYSNASDDSTGFVIEKKKLIVQYRPSAQAKYNCGNVGNSKKLVAKCSHSPKEAHVYHENQLKHPFYQNTQRLDELLDRFLNKNLPEIIADPFGLDFLFKPKKEKCKHPQPTVNVDILRNTEKEETSTKKKEEKPTLTTAVAETSTIDTTTLQSSKVNVGPDMKYLSINNNGRTQIPKPKMKPKKLRDKYRKLTTIIKPSSEIMKMLRPESTTVYEGSFNEHKAQMIGKEKMRIVTSSPSDFEVLLSVSTIMNPKIKKAARVTNPFIYAPPPNLRHLMQMDGEEEENLGYEDFKEVLTDEMESQDEVDRRVGDRKKRNRLEKELGDYGKVTSRYTTVGPEIPEKIVKYNPPGVQNPNWKGPMPLYPDEINSMIKHSSTNVNHNKELGSDEKDVLTAPTNTNRQRRDLSDVEYVEDYLDNKYDKLVEMAQAYSDYGVLEGKKDTVRNEKNPATDNINVEHRVKLSADGAFNKRRLAEKQNKEQYGTINIIPTRRDTIHTTSESEGIRFEIRPTTPSKLDDTHIYKFFDYHFKINMDDARESLAKTTMIPNTYFDDQQRILISVPSSGSDIPYTPRVSLKLKPITKKKEESVTEDTLQISSEGKALIENLLQEIKESRKQNKKPKVKKSDNDLNLAQLSNFKGDNITELYNPNSKKLTNNVKQLSGNVDGCKNYEPEVCAQNPATAIASQELDDYNMRRATKMNVDIYRYPYLATVKSGQPTMTHKYMLNKLPMTKMLIPESQTDEGMVIILAPDEVASSTMESQQTSIINTDAIGLQGSTEETYHVIAYAQDSNETSEFEQKQGSDSNFEPSRSNITGIEQSPSLTTEIDQNASLTTEIEQSASLTTEIEQSASLTTEIEQSASLTTEIDQSASLTNEIEQSASLTTEIEQSASLTTEIEQSPSLKTEIEESPSITTKIEQSPSSLSELQQSANRSSEFEQHQTTPSESEQDEDELSESEQDEDELSDPGLDESTTPSQFEDTPSTPSELQKTQNKPSEIKHQGSKLPEFGQNPSESFEYEEHGKSAEMENILSEIKQSKNVQETFKSNDTLVTLHHCEMISKGDTRYEGQIVLTLQNPNFGIKNIELNFDSSFSPVTDATDAPAQDEEVIDDENAVGQGVTVSIHENATAAPTLPASMSVKITGRRGRREVEDIERILDSIKSLNETVRQEVAQDKNITTKIYLANDTKPILNITLQPSDLKKLFNITPDNPSPKPKSQKESTKEKLKEEAAKKTTISKEVPKNNESPKESENKAQAQKKNNSQKSHDAHDEALITVDHKSENMTLSEFFMLLSKWFKTLEGLKERNEKLHHDPVSEISDFIEHFNNEINSTALGSTISTSTFTYQTETESVYPMYDSDMIENIGHRSRVLLSVKDSNATENDNEGTSVSDETAVTKAKSANVSVQEANSTVATASTTQLTANITASEQDKHTTASTPKKDSDSRKVKRNADDSNLIFWNDIYDDEYGIQADNHESVIRGDKLYTKNNDFIKRSGRWVQDKIKKFAENLKGRDQVGVVKSRLPRSPKRIGDYPRYISNKIASTFKKRSSNDQDDEEESDQLSVFNNLAINMVDVCKKAAMAVKQTSNTEPKEDPMQSNVATSLMQQLVRLLTDLVDYQVQARTCAKLPPDLKSFLEWLTLSDDELDSSEPEPSAPTTASPAKTTASLYPEEAVLNELVKVDHNTDIGSTVLTDSFSDRADYKTMYLETLRSVQDLIDQYEEMNDAEKSKMTGVKFYLQNQLRFLNKLFSGYDMYSFFDKHGLPLLYKRELLTKDDKRTTIRNKRKLNKFIRTFSKKHTRTTASYYDGMVTEMKKAKDVFDSRLEAYNRQERLKQVDPKNVKRNLKDVYYKAIAEAKKYTKSGHKKQESIGISSTQSTRAQNSDM